MKVKIEYSIGAMNDLYPCYAKAISRHGDTQIIGGNSYKEAKDKLLSLLKKYKEESDKFSDIPEPEEIEI